jgi:hypothetical protein
MIEQDNMQEPGSRRRRSPPCWGIFLRSAALALVALSLISPVTTNASEGPQTDPKSSGDEIVKLRPGWSELEPSVLDVQAWDWLQQDLDRLFDETAAPRARQRTSPEAFEEKFVHVTAEFLEIDPVETDTFKIAVTRALEEIQQARSRLLLGTVNAELDLDESAAMLASRALWVEYGEAQRHAARHPLAVLQAQPRHELLREDMLKWLLRLAYGIGEVAK